MNLNTWIVTLTLIITVVPLIKMTKEKRFSLYNLFVVAFGTIVLILSLKKLRNDEVSERNKEQIALSNSKKIESLIDETKLVRNDLSNVKKSLDSFGLALTPDNSQVVVKDKEKLKSVILLGNQSTNVTSINQKGGQTARDITNN